jgi:hypothetical protein
VTIASSWHPRIGSPTTAARPRRSGSTVYGVVVERTDTGGRITFADLSTPIYLGDEVRGRVALPPELDGVDEVTVSLAFETAGSCDPERAILRETRVRRPAGRPSVDFALAGPRWPPTYRGRLFTGRWIVEARAGDQAVHADLGVHAPAGHPGVTVANPPRPPRPGGRARRVRQLVYLALVEAACVALVVVGLSRGEGYWALGLVVGLVMLLPMIGTVLGLATVRAAGEMDVTVEPAGAGVAVRVRLGDPSRATAATATLVGREMTQRLAGRDNRESREEVIHQHAVTLAPDGADAFAGTVPVPPHPAAPFTISHSNAQVGWSVQVRVAITGAPDHSRTVALILLPATGSGADMAPRWTVG